MMTIRKYTADDLHKLLMQAREEESYHFDSLSIDDWEQTAKVQALLDKFDGKHNYIALEAMCNTCEINMQGKTRERIVCEICAFHADNTGKRENS